MLDLTPSMTRWQADRLDVVPPGCAAPEITRQDLAQADPAVCLWDAWPILTPAGDLASPELWMALAAPWHADPEERHARSRIHLLDRAAGGWRNLGPAMPDGFSPGSREWSGSAVLAGDGQTLTLYFTAAGRRGEETLSYEQRMFEARATLARSPDGWRLEDWRGLTENIIRDNRFYMSSLDGTGGVGTIKAFRDPGFFLDPVSGRSFLLFTASLAGSASRFNGAIGAAVARDKETAQWQVLPPLIGADGLNNELERPHVLFHAGRYYLFWSTQSHVFDPAGPIGPTGLYGMVSDSLLGGWKPLNGSGLVIANPAGAPRQAYSWYVLPDLSVTSFIDDWGRGPDDPGPVRFGGCFAPFLRLRLDGAATTLA